MKKNKQRIKDYSKESNGITTQLVSSSSRLVPIQEQEHVIRTKANGWFYKQQCELNRITDLITFEPSQADVRRSKR